ncbi:MAG: hypothetical protein HKN22_00625 [Bacteroidia bacterium]|nr:hypothetical protein [Bacteroidia bacterium]
MKRIYFLAFSLLCFCFVGNAQNDPTSDDWSTSGTITSLSNGSAHILNTGLNINPEIRIFSDDGLGTSSFAIRDLTANQMRLEKYTAAGAALIDINPFALDGTSAATFRFFRLTNTSGPVFFEIFKGDGSATVQSRLSANGNSFFNVNTGNVGIGTTVPATKLHVGGLITATGGNSTNWNTAFGWGDHTAADSVLQALVDAETAVRSATDSTLAADLQAEANRAITAEQFLSTADSVLQTLLQDEIDLRSDADSVLAAELLAEANRALAAEQILSTTDSILQTLLQDEIDLRSAADSTLAADLQAEANRAIAAENALQNALNGETQQRIDADSLLQVVVDSLVNATEQDPKIGAIDTCKVPKWNGSQLVAGSIFDNGTSIGIGTATPDTLFPVHIVKDVDGHLNVTMHNLNSGANAYSAYWAKTDINAGVSMTAFSSGFSVTTPATYFEPLMGLIVTDPAMTAGLAVGTHGSRPLKLVTNYDEHARITPNGDFGIGTSTPVSKLDVQGISTSTSDIINSKSNYSGNVDVRAIKAESVTAPGYGYGVEATGGYRGVVGIATSTTFAGTSHGIHGSATGSAGTRIGVFGTASNAGGVNAYGVYGTASGATNNWAGYFDGDVNVNGVLSGDGSGLTNIPNDGDWSVSGSQMSSSVTGHISVGDVVATHGRIQLADTNTAALVSFHTKSVNQFNVIFEDNNYRGYFGSYAGNAEDIDIGTGSGNTTGTMHLTIQGAPKLSVDPQGDVGIGTTTPDAKLHVYGRTLINGSAFISGDVGGLPSAFGAGVRIFMNPSDSAGQIYAYDYAAGSPRHLRLQQAGGNVGIGTSTPINKLDVNGKISLTQSVNDEMVIINDDIWNHSSGNQDFGDGGDYFIMASREGASESAGIFGDGDHVTIWSAGDAATGQPAAHIYVNDEDFYNGFTDSDPFNNGALQAYLDQAGNWNSASDRNRKENIKPLESSLSKLEKVNGYSYNFKLSPEEIKKGDEKVTTYGVIAQEVYKVFPELVDINDDGEHFLSYTEFIPILIESVKEQQEEIETLEEKAAKVVELEKEVKTNQEEIADLKNALEAVMQQMAQFDLDLQQCCLQHQTGSTHSNGSSTGTSIDDKAHLAQNVPNPFNERTIIKYYIPNDRASANARASISIMDMKGTVLWKFDINEFGYGQIEIDANTFAPATYLYQLIVGDKIIDIKKMTISN